MTSLAALAPTTPSLPPGRARRLAFFSELVGSGRSLTPGSRPVKELSPHMEVLALPNPEAAPVASFDDDEETAPAATIAVSEPTPIKPKPALELESAGTPTLNPVALEFVPPQPKAAAAHLCVDAPEFVPLVTKPKIMLSAAAPAFVPPTADEPTGEAAPTEQPLSTTTTTALPAATSGLVRTQLQLMTHELDASKKRAANAEARAMSAEACVAEARVRLSMMDSLEKELAQMRIVVGIAKQAASREQRASDDLRQRVSSLSEQLREAVDAKVAIGKALDVQLAARRDERELVQKQIQMHAQQQQQQQRMSNANSSNSNGSQMVMPPLPPTMRPPMPNANMNVNNKRQRAEGMLPGWEPMPEMSQLAHANATFQQQRAAFPFATQPTFSAAPPTQQTPLLPFQPPHVTASLSLSVLPIGAQMPPQPAAPALLERAASAPVGNFVACDSATGDDADGAEEGPIKGAEMGDQGLIKGPSRSRRGGRGKGHKNKQAAALAALAVGDAQSASALLMNGSVTSSAPKEASQQQHKDASQQQGGTKENAPSNLHAGGPLGVARRTLQQMMNSRAVTSTA